MARPLRLEFAGALWHIISRGNERRDIFRDDADRRSFLENLGKTVTSLRWRLYAYTLMSNHYHLVAETAEPNLSRGMHAINGRYGQTFNRRHARSGHLFQSRFKGILVEKESHLLELLRYVVLNPVRAGMAATAKEYQWSSYRATAGLEPAPPWLEVDAVLDQLRAPTRSEAQTMYRAFVAEGLNSPDQRLKMSHGTCIGGDAFRQRLLAIASEKPRSGEFPRDHREPWRPDLPSIVEAVIAEFATSAGELRLGHGGIERTALAYLARYDGSATLEEIRQFLHLTDSGVSRLVRQAERLLGECAFRTHIRSIRDRLRERSLTLHGRTVEEPETLDIVEK